MPSYVTHLEGAIDGARLPKQTLQTLHAGRPIWVRYDLDGVRRAVDRDAIGRRQPTMWRYRELLPVEDDANIVTLGEGMTPLLSAPRLGEAFGLSNLLVKDEASRPVSRWPRSSAARPS
jgi:threonine synthase